MRKMYIFLFDFRFYFLLCVLSAGSRNRATITTLGGTTARSLGFSDSTTNERSSRDGRFSSGIKGIFVILERREVLQVFCFVWFVILTWIFHVHKSTDLLGFLAVNSMHGCLVLRRLKVASIGWKRFF